jgi:tetratricopeptide (TPR) repeat protein
MNINNKFRRQLARVACILLCCGCLKAGAGEVEDAGKLFREGQHAQALVRIDAYLARNPKDASARFLKGLIYTEQGKTEDAIRIFQKLTEDYPEYPEPFNNLAVLYAGQEQYDKAKSALEAAIRTHPSYATAHENLGDIYAKLASQAYDRALQLDRGNTSSQTKLNMIQNLFVEEVREKPASDIGSTPATPGPAQVPVTVSQVEQVKVAPKAPPAVVVTKAEAKPAAADSRAEVLKAVNGWAAAWSAQDVPKYLSYYAADFATPANQSREEWETVRKDRLTAPKYIKVTISGEKITFADNEHATVSFRQAYRASHLKATGKKTLQMVRSAGTWLIKDEQSR